MNASERLPLLDVRGLTTLIGRRDAPSIKPVDDVTFSLSAGEVMTLIGESGSGKSTLAMSLMRLLSREFSVQGQVFLDGEDLLALDEREMTQRRGRRMALIQQNPMVSLDPLFTVGSQLLEALRLHTGLEGDAARQRALGLLRGVRIPAPEARLGQYPYQMSGGMLQRLVGAIALAGAPSLLIADEPTTALDPTVQAQFLNLLDDLRRREQLTILLVTHDLSVAARMADQVAVMYAGRVVERQAVARLFDAPAHPYTQALMATAQGVGKGGAQRQRMPAIAGQPPNLAALPSGCAFAPRCPRVHDRCGQRPPDTQLPGGGRVACWLFEGTRDGA